jgi:hypothetical protein
VKWPILLSAVIGSAALADADIFHGWAKDGTWLAFQSSGSNEVVELSFCATSADVPPTWPAALNEMERESGPLSCVRFIDANKAPYQWQSKMVLPAPTMKQGGMTVQKEMVAEGEVTGIAVLRNNQTHVCAVPGVRDSSQLQKAWFSPNGKFLAAVVDGTFRHCLLAPADPQGAQTTKSSGKPTAKPASKAAPKKKKPPQ